MRILLFFAFWEFLFYPYRVLSGLLKNSRCAMPPFPSILDTVGHTPLVRLEACLEDAKATVLVKLENRNPAGSVKCRVGAAMIEDAERRGLIKEGVELIEPTSGNTGIGLAFVAAAKKIPLTLVMPENMSLERRKLLAFLGAKLILTPVGEGMRGSILLAEKMVAEEPSRFLLLQQFKNPANPAIHEQTTGPEIWNDCGGVIDIFAAGVGTGGTITGVARYIKKTCGKPIKIVAIEPSESPVIQQTLAKEKLTPSSHGLQGIGAGFVPETLDLSLVDEAVSVNLYDAYDYAKRLAKEEGILSGISGGANVAVAARLAQKSENAGKTIVTIIPDSAERYLSTPLFREDLDS